MNHLYNNITIEQKQEQVEIVNRYCIDTFDLCATDPSGEKIIVSISTTRN